MNLRLLRSWIVLGALAALLLYGLAPSLFTWGTAGAVMLAGAVALALGDSQRRRRRR